VAEDAIRCQKSPKIVERDGRFCRIAGTVFFASPCRNLLNLQFHNTSKVAAKFSANFGRKSEIKTKGFLAFIATASLQISTFVVKQQFHLPAAIFHHSVLSKPKLKISAEGQLSWCVVHPSMHLGSRSRCHFYRRSEVRSTFIKSHL
jgi:hypothetical protein